MNTKLQLNLLNFLQFFIWGCWLITIGSYLFQLGWSPSQFGYIYATIGISAIGFPAFFGYLTDRYFSLIKVYRALHLSAALLMLLLPSILNPDLFFLVLLLYMIAYMASIPMLVSFCYSKLNEENYNVKSIYPKIRVWGSIGFILALWLVSLSGNETSVYQFYLSSLASLVLFAVTFFISETPRIKPKVAFSFQKAFGLHVFQAITNKEVYYFFGFAFFFGIALIVSNGYTNPFLHDIKTTISNPEAILVKYPAIVVSVSQIAEVFFILLMPFVLKRLSIPIIVLLSFIAWTIKFLLLSLVSPENSLFLVLMSCVFYGMAFNFFLIAGSIYLDENTVKEYRGSMQGFFVMVVNGFGALFGSFTSGLLIDSFFTTNATKDWPAIWLFFAVLLFLVVILYFLLLWKKKTRKVSV
jgi:NHS family xanthosine MFS transporter